MRGWGMQQGWGMTEKGWESSQVKGMARGSPPLDRILARVMARGSPGQGSSLARVTRCQAMVTGRAIRCQAMATAMARGNPGV